MGAFALQAKLWGQQPRGWAEIQEPKHRPLWDAMLDAAIHQLVVGHHHSLLVTKGGEIVGVLRLTDVFKEVCQRIKECMV